MKIIIQTLALLLCLQAAKADNLAWLVKLTIEQKDGSKTVGYISFVEGGISKDSLNNTGTLSAGSTGWMPTSLIMPYRCLQPGLFISTNRFATKTPLPVLSI